MAITGQTGIQQWSVGGLDSATLLVVGSCVLLLYLDVYIHIPLLLTLIDSAYEKLGGGSGPIFMDFVNCTGSEQRLWDDCYHFTHYDGCSHDDDIGVQCQPGNNLLKICIISRCDLFENQEA